MPATSSQSASAGVTVGHASWTSRSTGTEDAPPIRTARPKAAVSAPAVLSAILSTPAQPDGSRRVLSSTPPHRRGRAGPGYNARPLRRSRSSCAATSGATTQRFRPVPSSSPARWVSRGRMSIRQQNVSAPRGAVRIQRFSGGEAPSRRRRRSSASCSSAGAGRAVVLEARLRAPRDEHELEREPRRVGRHQHRVVVDRDDPVAHPHLLLDAGRRAGCRPSSASRRRRSARARARSPPARTAARRAAHACGGARRRPRAAR